MPHTPQSFSRTVGRRTEVCLPGRGELTEDEWSASEHGRAADSFIKTAIALGVVLASAEFGSLITNKIGPVAAWAMAKGSRFGVKPETAENLLAQQKYFEMLDPELDQAVRSSAIVIGACSAIEAYIEQFTKIRMRDHPELLDGTKFEASSVAAKKSLTDADDIFEGQWRSIKSSPGKEPDQHERFEKILGVVGQSGSTPTLIESGVNTAYAVRNVWAHNAGTADKSFASKLSAQPLGFQVGDLVNLSSKASSRYLSVILTYGMMIANRERIHHGLGPIPLERNAGETDYGQAYKAMYN